MAQTEYSTVGENTDGHAQGGNYTGCPFPPFSLEKKKKKLHMSITKRNLLWSKFSLNKSLSQTIFKTAGKPMD
jgi:hypothetical protein